MALVRALLPEVGTRVMAMAGQTARRRYDGAGQALHRGSALATVARLALAPTPTAAQSPELPAMPARRRLRARRGATGSRAVLGCQRPRAAQMVTGGGQALLGLTGNQATLPAEVVLSGAHPPAGAPLRADAAVDQGPGRLETRRGEGPNAIAWRQDSQAWPPVPSLVRLLANTRRPWAIAHTRHGTLARSCGADAWRMRTEHAPLAVASIRHVALH